MIRPSPCGRRQGSITLLIAASSLLPLTLVAVEEPILDSGRAVFQAACASCHGSDGRGAPASLTTLDTPPPDFTDCDFANREPDCDWVGIAYEGGPSRGFSEIMPAFDGVLTVEQVQTGGRPHPDLLHRHRVASGRAQPAAAPGHRQGLPRGRSGHHHPDRRRRARVAFSTSSSTSSASVPATSGRSWCPSAGSRRKTRSKTTAPRGGPRRWATSPSR